MVFCIFFRNIVIVYAYPVVPFPLQLPLLSIVAGPLAPRIFARLAPATCTALAVASIRGAVVPAVNNTLEIPQHERKNWGWVKTLVPSEPQNSW